MAIRYSSPIVSDNLISLIDFSNIKSVKFSDDFTFVDITNKENVISSCGNTTLGKKSLHFSGSTGSQLDLQDLITSRIIETNVSFSIWFKLSNLSSDHFLIKTGDEDSDPPINIFFDTSATGVENTGGSDIGGGNTNVITCQFSDSTQDYKFTTSNNIINASQWYNLTVSLDFSSNIHHMYLDGSLVAKWNHTTGSNGIKSHTNSFLLGKGLNGNIGKFYAYRKSLNSEEVKQNYDVEVFRDFDQDSSIDRLVLNASPFDSSVPNRSENISQLSNDAIFTSIGSTDWTIPSGVYEISVVCVGGGGGASGSNESDAAGAGGGGGALRYVNNVDVTPGETLTVVVGAGGNGGVWRPPNSVSWMVGAGDNGQTSSLSRSGTILCSAAGGKGGPGSSNYQGQDGSGGSTGIGTGGNGGNGGPRTQVYYSFRPGGGGGAGGYSGNGGTGGSNGFNTSFGSGSGGGAAGGSYHESGAGAGGGVGLYGEGESGLYFQVSGSTGNAPGGAAGSGGSTGEPTISDSDDTLSVGDGGLYGGGGGGGSGDDDTTGGSGGQGAVRIIWGGCLDGTYYGREFPSSNANQIYSNSNEPFSYIPLLHFDAGDINSYSGSGVAWTNLGRSSVYVNRLSGKFFAGSWISVISTGNIGKLPLTAVNESTTNTMNSYGMPSADHRYGINLWDYITYYSLTFNGDPYGFIAIGYFKPPTTGIYTFYTSSADGSGVWIGSDALPGATRTTSNAVVNNGMGTAQSNTERSGTVSLIADTYYPIRIVHEENFETYSGDAFTFSWSGPNISKTTDLTQYFYSDSLDGEYLTGNYLGYEGTLINEPTYNSNDGGGTIVFDGSNDLVNVGNFTLPTAYTINMFIKFLDTSSGNKAILDFGSYRLDTFLYASTLRLYLQDGYVKIQHDGQFASTGVLSSFIPTTETWYNLTVTFDGNTAKMYFNSTLNSSGTLVSPSTNYTIFGIADHPLGNGSSILPLNCSISYVEIFDRVLTASEITQNYNAHKSRYGL